MGGQSKILGWVIAGLVVVLAALTIIIVRSTAQPEPPDLTPVEVTPESTATTDGEPSANDDSTGSEGTASAKDDDRDSSGAQRDGSSDSSGPQEIEHSYEPVPNPPREVPGDDADDDDDDAGDDDDDAGDDDDDAGDDDDDDGDDDDD